MGRIAIAVLLFLILPAIVLAQAPICDTTCAPDPGSGGYSGTEAARSKPYNARGSGLSIVPRTPTGPRGGGGGRPTSPLVNNGSESYQYAIPIIHLPGRNGLDLDLSLYYNSRIWTVDKANSTVTFNADRDFPSYGFRLDYGYLEYDSGSDTYTLTQRDGSKSLLSSNGTTYDSGDSTYINYDSTAHTLRYKNGLKVTYEVWPSQATLFRPTQIMDTNGNFITITYLSGHDQMISTITDTLGRILTFNYDASFRLQTITQGTFLVASFTWNTTFTLRYTFSGLTVKSSPASGTTNLSVLAGCTYPDNTGYTFVYGTNGDWGIIKEIDYKSSAGTTRSSVSYNYPNYTPALSDAPTFTQQTVYDGQNTGVWAYSTVKSGGLVSTMTVTDPSGAKVKTTLSTVADWTQGLATQVQYQNSSSVTQRTLAFTWISDGGASNPRQSRITTTLENTEQSKVELTYTTNGNVSELYEYDYGPNLKRRTSTTYWSGGSSAHILDRPAQVQVKDGAGAIFAQTNLDYDTFTPTSVLGAAHHDDTYSGPRGNLTTITRLGGVTRNFTYDTLGNLLTAQLDCCNQKQWTYDSANQYAYPTTVVSGPAGTQLTTSATYDFNSGLTTRSTDENSKNTDYAYESSTRRLSTVTQPNSVTTTLSYDDAAPLPKVTRSTSAGNSPTVATTFDGVGHPLQRDLKDGASAFSTVQTVYDSLGRVIQSSNPYGPSESQLWTVTQYDALSRPTSVTPPGSVGSYTYAYSGQAVLVTDPAGKQRRNITDGLGRLVRVDEPGWGDSAPGKGSVTISGASISGDSGTVSITVNGLTKTVTYPYGKSTPTAAGIAISLALAFGTDSNSPVNASVTGSTVNFTAKTNGYATNYVLSTGVVSTPGFSPPSFASTPTGGTLTGGRDSAGGADTASISSPMPTTYTYDVLDNLLSSSEAAMPVGGQQLAAQNRSYAYDSLSRLTQATTPESGTVSYSYTTVGGSTCSADPSLVCRRTDARSVISTYTYDGLNRLTGISYSDSTPAVAYTYGTSAASNNNGRLLTASAASFYNETYSYDTIGRITQVSKVIDSNTYNIGYAYNNANQVTSITYPSGRAITQGFDGVGRLGQILTAGSPPYLTIASADYNAAGQVKHVLYGNTVQADLTYNDHLQIATLRYSKPSSPDLLNLGYDYTTATVTGNNGQIQKVHYYTAPGTEDATKTQNYEYDAWLRIKKAYTTNLTTDDTWQLQWDYDRFGNRKNQTMSGGVCSSPPPGFVCPTQPQLGISETTNRITDSGFAYDAAGNLTNDGIHTYTYDAENRIKTVDATAATYTYASGPLRIKKVVGTTTTVYIFSGSKVIAEYVNGSLSKEYVYAGRKLLATIAAGGATSYQYPDHLSPRVEADDTGAVSRAFAHYPFGEIWYETGTASKWKFTSYERDSESALDYAIFRNYSSRLGRFMQADLLAGHIVAPQSMNRYSYSWNQPTNLTDPLGLDCSFIGDTCSVTVWGNSGSDPARSGFFVSLQGMPGFGRGFHSPLLDTDVTDFGKEFQKAEELIRKKVCSDFIAQVIQAATLAAAQQSDPSKLGPGERDIYNTTPEGVLDASENASLIEQPKVDPTENGFRTAATADYWNQSITLYDAFYEQGTTGRAQIFVHEGIHLVFPFSDAQLAAAAGVPAGPNESAANNFQQELARHCK